MEKKQEIDDVVYGKDILSTGIAPVVQKFLWKKEDKICPLYWEFFNQSI